MKVRFIKYKAAVMAALLLAISSSQKHCTLSRYTFPVSIHRCIYRSPFKSNSIPSSTTHIPSTPPQTQSKMKPTPLTLTALLLSASSPAISCQVQTNWKITFFGYPDNSPPSGDIAFDCGRGFAAGGDGSLNDPVTMAAAYNVFAKCEVIYIPYLKKYARYEDYCGQCGTFFLSLSSLFRLHSFSWAANQHSLLKARTRNWALHTLTSGPARQKSTADLHKNDAKRH